MEPELKNPPAVASAQVDRFIHERLPPDDQWPELILPPGFAVNAQLNCAELLLDRHVAAGIGARPALIRGRKTLGYDQLHEQVNRIAHVLTRDFGVVPGGRVLLRAPNSPMLVAQWLAVQKAGAIAVTTMPLLRSGELAVVIDMSRPAVAVCDAAITAELEQAIGAAASRCRIITFEDDGGGELVRRMARQPADFDTVKTASDDISLLGFTSGTTGRPKATIHFHRDIQAICQTVADRIIDPRPDDRFIGTAPLAFTFGLGGLAVFPLYGGAASILYGRYRPEELLAAIREHRASVCFTVPTFYQRMARIATREDAASLRLAVSSGEALPLPVREAWQQTTGLPLTEVLGATEMLHAFIGAAGDEIRRGAIGRAIPPYEAVILDERGEPLPAGAIGRLAVRGPTGCRYLDDPRQRVYVQYGWNITGDACSMDEDGYVTYHTRLDDLIISSGYNISGVEVENALLEHPGVAECAVIGTPDPERGQVVTAYVVPRSPPDDESEFAGELEVFVKARLAPYKYPRKIRFVAALPRNESGKLQRFRLRSPD